MWRFLWFVLPALTIIQVLRDRSAVTRGPLFYHLLLLLAWPGVYDVVVVVIGFRLEQLLDIPLKFGPAIVYGLFRTASSRRTSMNSPVLLIFLIPATAICFSVFAGQSIQFPVSWAAMALPALWIWQEVNLKEQSVAAFRSAVRLIFAANLILVLAQPSQSFGACRSDKCGIFGFNFTPGGMQSNNLTLTLGLLLAASLVGLPSKQKVMCFVSSAILVDLAGGRTGLLTLVVSSATVVLVDGPRHPVLRKRLSLLAVLAAFLASWLPVAVQVGNDFATRRGSLWNLAKELASDSPLLGYGPSFWVRQASTSTVVANYSAHNLWLELMVAGGAVAVLTLIAGGIWAMRTSDASVAPLLMVLASALLAGGIFEATIMPYRLTLIPGVFIAFLLLCSCRLKVVPEPGLLPRPLEKSGSHADT